MYNIIWYQMLNRPPLTPPNWIFGPVWVCLYVFIFVAFIFYFLTKDENKKLGFLYFGVQLILNFLWSPVFFALKNIFLALIIVVLLDIFIFLTIKEFYKISKISAYLLIPYFLWTCFATYLNIGYLILN